MPLLYIYLKKNSNVPFNFFLFLRGPIFCSVVDIYSYISQKNLCVMFELPNNYSLAYSLILLVFILEKTERGGAKMAQKGKMTGRRRQRARRRKKSIMRAPRKGIEEKTV